MENFDFEDTVSYFRAWFKCLLVHIVSICLFVYHRFNKTTIQTNNMTPYLIVLTQAEQSFSYDSSISLTSGNKQPKISGNNMTYVIRLLPYLCPPKKMHLWMTENVVNLEATVTMLKWGFSVLSHKNHCTSRKDSRSSSKCKNQF